MACKYTTSMYLGVGTTICASISCSRSGSTINVWGSASVSQGNAWNLNAIYACVDGGTGWFRVKPYTNSGGSWESGFSFSFSDNNAGSRGYTVWFAVYNNAESGSVGSWDSVYVDFSYGANYTAPATPTATNLVSDGTAHKAYSKVQGNGWGTNCSRRNFEIICGGSIKASDYNNSPASMYWTLPTGSNNTSACGVNTWYGRAVNNQVLWTDSSAKYVASPSAPIMSYTGSASTTPQTTANGTVTYRGGTQNSSTCDNGEMKTWQFGLLTSSQTGVPGTLTTYSSTGKSYTHTYSSSDFALGTSYKFYCRTVNNYGGASSTTSAVVYCPTGVGGSNPSKTSTSLNLRASCNYGGTIGSSTSGDVACYQIKWSTDQATVDDGGGTELTKQTGTDFTVSGLTPNTTIYYRVYAWNVYGLSNVSNTLTATTIPRYDPETSVVSVTPLTPGATVNVRINNTGGLYLNELTVTSLKLEGKPASSTTWTTLQNATSLSLHANDTYSFANAWTTDRTVEGDYNLRITTSNGTDTGTTLYTVSAPVSVDMMPSQVKLAPNQPIQITSSAYSGPNIYKWVLEASANGVTLTKTELSDESVHTMLTQNYLDYDTVYDVHMVAYNSFGLWRRSTMQCSVLTEPRVKWYLRKANRTLSMTPLFKQGTNAAKNITDVYYVVKDSFGNIHEGDNIGGKRLTFPTHPLHYCPQNIASVELSNGKTIAYDYDETDDVYKFGIWGDSGIETTFFDGNSWLVTTYVIGNNLTVSRIDTTGRGLNSSAPFASTSCTTVMPWESE